MTKFIILLALLISVSSFAQEDNLEKPFATDSGQMPKKNPTPEDYLTQAIDPAHKKFNPYKSHFNVQFGFEGMKYDTPFSFTGVKNNFSPKERELWGGRLGLQGEIYLGKGFNTTTKVEGYYQGTLFSRVLNGGTEDANVKFAYTKRTGQIYGMDAAQALGYVFDMKTKNPFMDEWTYLYVEPYIEAGVGIAAAYNRINYKYALSGTNEGYKESVNDDLKNTKLGVGINFTSSSGFFFYMKATQNRYDVTLRKDKRYTRDNSGVITNNGTEKLKNVNIDPIMVYAIGGGYKF